MESPKVILAPTDLTESSLAAVGFAAKTASCLGSSVRVFHARPMRRRGPDEQLSELARGLREEYGGLDVSTSVATGSDPAKSILDEAESIGADLIVISTHSRGEISRFIMGSTTTQVIRRSAVPVLTMRQAPAIHEEHGRRFVVAVDRGRGLGHLLRWAIEITLMIGDDFEVMHVVEPQGSLIAREALPELQGVASTEEERRAALAQIEEQLNAAFDELGIEPANRPRVHIRCLVGFAPNTLREHLQSAPPDLLILGTHGRRGVSRAAIGSVAERLVTTAKCPVVVLRPHPEQLTNDAESES